uniref:J domain-containing protein n=2 Tax=Graphocephala atropunctata TaxID=36148 RepID=A0A1B6MQD0_9HEMI
MEPVVQRLPISRNGVILRCSYISHKIIDYQTSMRFYSTRLHSAEYTRCYNVLNVKVDSDQETVRQAFLKLVKRFHPDSGSSEADGQKFQEIEKAYRKLQQKFHAERWSDRWGEGAGEYGLYYKEKKAPEIPVVEHDIKHTAPQHRQYLTYDGFGAGTPSQRHKQYQKLRASTAIDNVFNHRISRVQEAESLNEEQALVVKDKQRAKNIKTRYGMDRLVEDLIQESMAKGEFDNLSGKGKPLSTRQDHYNPYVDLVTHKMNQVMIDNGFMPEWISLQKEIRADCERLREKLEKERAELSSSPLPTHESRRWAAAIDSIREDVQAINAKIGKFNLVVPLLHNQMLLFNLEREAAKVLAAPPKKFVESESKPTQIKHEEQDSFIGLLMSVFNR